MATLAVALHYEKNAVDNDEKNSYITGQKVSIPLKTGS